MAPCVYVNNGITGGMGTTACLPYHKHALLLDNVCTIMYIVLWWMQCVVVIVPRVIRQSESEGILPTTSKTLEKEKKNDFINVNNSMACRPCTQNVHCKT